MDPEIFTFHVAIPLFLQCRGMYSYPLIQLVTVRLVVDPHGTFVAGELASSDPPLNFLAFARLCYHCLPSDVGFLRRHRGRTDRPSKTGDLWLWSVERWGRVQTFKHGPFGSMPLWVVFVCQATPVVWYC